MSFVLIAIELGLPNDGMVGPIQIALDVDGTIDAFPVIFQSLMSAFMAAGHHVFVITGVDATKVTKTDIANKTAYLTGLGCGKGTYTTLIVLPQPHDTNKAKVIKEEKIELLFDNSKANCKAAKDYCLCLLSWLLAVMCMSSLV